MTEQEKKEWLEENVKIKWLSDEEIDELIDNSNIITVDMSEDEWMSWSNEALKNN